MVTIRLSYSPTNKHVFKILNSVDMYRIIHRLQKNLSSIIYILYMEGLLRPLSTTLTWIINCQIRHIFVYNLVISSSLIKYITQLPQIMAWNFFVYIYLNSLFYTWQVSSWSKYSIHNHIFPAPKLKKKGSQSRRSHNDRTAFLFLWSRIRHFESWFCSHILILL